MKAIRTLAAVVGICAMLYALGAVGAVERGEAGLMYGTVRAAAGMAACAACIRIGGADD